jgi:putative transposase
MDNHYHLLLRTPRGNLSRGMKDANAIYAQSYNRRSSRCGPLFQGRYKAYLIEEETYLLKSARYIVLNPVRAGICAHPSSWPFCSYRATTGLDKPPPFLSPGPLLSHFSSNLACARRRYREFVSAGIAEDAPLQGTGGVVLGGEELLVRIKEYLEPKRNIDEIPREQRFQDRPPLSEIFSEAAYRCIRSIRDDKIHVAYREYGYTQKEIGRHLGIDHSTVSLIIRTREKG